MQPEAPDTTGPRRGAGRPLPARTGLERLIQDGILALRLIAAVLAYLGVLSAVAVALFFVGTALLPEARQGPFGLLGLAVAEGAALLTVVLIWRGIDRQSLAALGLGRQPGRSPPRQWLVGAGVGCVLMGLVVFGWYTLVDGASWSTNPDAGRAVVALVAGLLGFLIQGPSEEVLFRGYLLEHLRARWGAGWAVGVSAVAFAALHAANPSFGLLPLLNLVLFGLATALYKLRVDGGQLWGVFAIHTVWNWLQQVVFGLPNSGNASTAANTLFSVQPNVAVPDVISGGGFGPEGTLATTLVLLGLIAAVLRLSGGRRPAAAPQPAATGGAGRRRSARRSASR